MAAIMLSSLALVGGVVAAINPSIDTQCLLAIPTILGRSPVSECFATSALTTSFLPALSNPEGSIVPALDTYLQAVCPAPLCDNSTVENTLESLEQSCSSLLQGLSISNSTINAYVPFLPKVKEIVCLESKENKTVIGTSNSTDLCVIQTLNVFQNATGQSFSISTLFSLLSGSTPISSLVNSSLIPLAPKLCTDCTKEVYNRVVSLTNSTSFMNATSSVTSGSANTTSFLIQFTKAVSSVCGNQFVNGSTPTTVKNGSTPSSVVSAKPSKGAASSTIGNTLGGVAISAVAGAFALLI